ncbi:FAD-dependent 5-carboxymethylaminomethyl-2-thiouridine(34) oxidoreductase MnmC [Shewanella mangrovi]|uniref:FAD-dependent 5-carboxymethylaminomethyl-2-thiouridine(34) oxidoreductase MnmC n=1 Tax=Shewanella mangrovi TaxID=1515746 RepID=UPI0006896A60|nr:FAD-dependent 5-carboxymethylaminomethyl-2-thiouridine(34) oxidoreductase MnmC [Shewanella mangrovi]
MQTSEHQHFSSSIAYCGVNATRLLFDEIINQPANTAHYRVLFLSATDSDLQQRHAEFKQQLHALPADNRTTRLKHALLQMSRDGFAIGQRYVNNGLCLDIYPLLNAERLKHTLLSKATLQRWELSESNISDIPHQLAWQMALISQNGAHVSLPKHANSALQHALVTAGFQTNEHISASVSSTNADIINQEKAALTLRTAQAMLAYPVYVEKIADKAETIAIIGAGVAGSQLALSLAEKGYKTRVFCADTNPGEAASGNRQGALYPLLTPETSVQNRFFVQAFEFSRQRIQNLVHYEPTLAHDFCGVLQTGFDERSRKRLAKIAHGQAWSTELLQWISAETATEIAGLDIHEDAIFYPNAGWVCPQQLTQLSLARAQSLNLCRFTGNCNIQHIERQPNGWWLTSATERFGPFRQLVLANGAGVTELTQFNALPISPFRGQVSEIDSNPTLAQLKTVLCAKGYLTPAWQQQHCLGATYIKDERDCTVKAEEQQDNLDKLRLSYAHHDWLESIEMGERARVGVRMVTRDHLPMVGPAPDISEIFTKAERLGPTPESIKEWQSQPAPILSGLYLLAGLGSRGICSGPLAAEILACELTHQPMPVSIEVLQALNPNRMWLRKLLKGRAITC